MYKLHSNQGWNFKAAGFGEVCWRLGIKKTLSIPLHPLSESLVLPHSGNLARHSHQPLVKWLESASVPLHMGILDSRSWVNKVHHGSPYVWMSAPDPGGLSAQSSSTTEVEDMVTCESGSRRCRSWPVAHWQRLGLTRSEPVTPIAGRGEGFTPRLRDKVWVFCFECKKGISP